MEDSQGIREAMLRYWEGLSTARPEIADQVIADTDPAVVIGTGPGEGREGPAAWRQGVRDTIEQIPGVRIEAGSGMRAWEHGDAGFLIDEPAWVMPDGSRIPTRATTVWARQDGDWRIVHLHLSVGVPDELLAQVIGG